MAKIVLGIGASHTTLMNTQWHQVEHLKPAHDYRRALGEAQAQLAAQRPDLVVIIGSNHFRGLWLDLMPSFLLGIDEIEASGEHGTPKGILRSNPEVAQQICDGLVGRDFDIAFSTHLLVDHGISHAVQWLMKQIEVPILPLIINCFAPPLPSLHRVLELGVALRETIKAVQSVERVAIIGTGGLSHSLPFPDWRYPETDNDKFLVDSWRQGRENWEVYEERRRDIVINAPAVINEAFDRDFMESIQAGDSEKFVADCKNDQLVETAGNGGNEVRAWLMMAATLGHHKAKVLNYSPVPEWLTGMAVAVIAPDACSNSSH